MDYDYTFKKEELNKCYNCRKGLDNVEIFLYKDKKYCVTCSPWNKFNSSFWCFMQRDQSNTLSNVSTMSNLSDFNTIDDINSSEKSVCPFNSFASLSSMNSNPIVYSIHNTYIFLTCLHVYCSILKQKIWK